MSSEWRTELKKWQQQLKPWYCVHQTMYAKAKEAIANKEMTEEKLEMPSNPTNLSTADTNQTFIDPTNVTQAHKSQVAHRRFVENALKDSYVLGMIGEFLRMKAQEQAQGTGPVTPALEEYIAPIPFAGDMDFFRLGARTPSPLGGARGHPGHPIKTPVSHTHLSTTPKTIYRV
jgi:hypothetical protein